MEKQKQDIADYRIYNERMSTPLIDKMFFLDKINPDFIVDFGCADGALLKEVRHYLPKTVLIGYDADPVQIEKARHNLKESKCIVSDDWWSCVKAITNTDAKPNSALVLSSIIHEIYTYSRPEEIDEFWGKVFSNFKYIVIRDMIPSQSIDRASDLNDVVKVLRKFHRTDQLNHFIHQWGTIESNKNLIHFLMKYRYAENWKREVKENYLPLYREDLLSMIPVNYNVLYHEHYVLPYLKNSVSQDFGIELKDNTHLKMILQRA